MSPRRKHKTRIERTYLIEIDDWSWRYSFSAHGDRFTGDSHTEFRHLHMTGKLLHPEEMKGGLAELILMPDKRHNEGARSAAPIPSVGVLNVLADCVSVWLDLPDDALASVISALGAGAIKYASLRGEKPRYRKAHIHDYALDRSYDKDDL